MQVSAMLCTSLVIHVRTSMWQEILWLINKPCGRKKLKQPKPQPIHNQALWLINIRLKKRQPQLRATTSNNQATAFSLSHNQPCTAKTTATRTGIATGSIFIYQHSQPPPATKQKASKNVQPQPSLSKPLHASNATGSI